MACLLFKGELYCNSLIFIKEIVTSIEDDTFIEKYGVQKKQVDTVSRLLNI